MATAEFLINRGKVRKIALEQAQKRAHKFTRVSQDYYIALNQKVHELIENHVANLPSHGKTIE